MEQIWAAIDIGTNSVRLLVQRAQADGWQGQKKVCITQLGQGLSQTRRLCQEAMDRTEQAVLAFAKQAVVLGAAKPVWCYATSAARQAENGLAFLQRLNDSGWVTAELLSGEEEARVAYQGSGAQGRPVLDVGGGSTELTVQRNAALAGRSVPLGCVTLKERFLQQDPMTAGQRRALAAECRAQTKKLIDNVLPAPPAQIVAVGGSATQLAMLALGLPAYDADRVHGYPLSAEQIDQWAETLSNMTHQDRKRLKGMEAKRADVVVCGAAIISAVLHNSGARGIVVSDRDGLDGYLAAKREILLDKQGDVV